MFFLSTIFIRHFVELSLNLLKENAKASLICQQSVLSISRFAPLRKLIEQESKIETLVQLGSGSFPTRPGEKVNNAIITLRKTSQSDQQSASATLRYARILYPEEKETSRNFRHQIYFVCQRLSNSTIHRRVKSSLGAVVPSIHYGIIRQPPASAKQF